MLQGTAEVIKNFVKWKLFVTNWKESVDFKRTKWMTATHNLNRVCLLEQRMAIFNKLIKVFFPEKETDVCKSQHVINFILLIDFTDPWRRWMGTYACLNK